MEMCGVREEEEVFVIFWHEIKQEWRVKKNEMKGGGGEWASWLSRGEPLTQRNVSLKVGLLSFELETGTYS